MKNEIVTFGCRLNIFESEVIREEAEKSGVEDSIIFNSCAVTSEAERQLRQSIRRHRRENPKKKIIVTGCAAQINPDLYADMDEVDVVMGNQEKLKSENYNFISDDDLGESQVKVADIMQLEENASHMVSDFSGKARAYLEIQNGCNHRCTFCIIPFGRGNNRSVPIARIVEHCREVIEQGYEEIVLTGVDITDYGTSLPGKPKLGYLIKEILKFCPTLKKVRLSSLDVAEIDDHLIELIKTEERLLPHFHLSIQSGDDMILKRMKRRHNRQQIIDFCDFVRKYRKDASIGADIIVGFPTENEEMFLNSVNLVKELKIPLLHVFPYSEREGTPAALIPRSKQVEKHIRKERAKLLNKVGRIELSNYMQRFVGREVKGILETERTATTDHFMKVEINSCNNFKKDKIGKEVVLKITAVESDKLIAQIC
jgi:threonylcarbamoyladenosine tRNA methylthiotransferase MtaB